MSGGSLGEVRGVRLRSHGGGQPRVLSEWLTQARLPPSTRTYDSTRRCVAAAASFGCCVLRHSHRLSSLPSHCPAMRFKNRYLLVQLLFSPPSLTLPSLTSYALYREVRQALLANFGEFGYGQVTNSLQVKYLNTHTNLVILRAPRDDADVIRAALVMIREVRGEACVLRVVHVGGTIRSCQKAAVKWTRSVLLELWRRRVDEKAARGSAEVREQAAAKAKQEVDALMAEAETEIGQLEM